MAINEKASIELQVVDPTGSNKKAIKNANALKAAYDAVRESATKTTKGSQTLEALRKATGGMEESQDYGRARGALGTGAAGRDFAKQSQGLGGLVRVYATFAANLFAVSAAFTALKNAADTTNLVKGLDELGAASGRNLGGLSKRLVEITDGAVSMRDAMVATAQATSGGMSAKNLERLTLVAKNTSQALGIAMPDALSRLTRGVTKLEPELLDELGIMVRVDKAVSDYSLSVGKASSQLTDFERRQAFANAVIAEGEQKFGALGAAAANPYDKLLASLSNVAQKGLETVNKVLGPAVALLSESPTALAIALASIGAILLKTALPAIGEFRESLAASADKALEISKNKAGDALAAREQLNRLIESKVEASADKQVDAVDAAERRILALQKDSINKRGAVYKLLQKDIDLIEQKDIDAAERRAKRLEEQAKKDPSMMPLAMAEREGLEAVKGQIQAEDELNKVKAINRAEIEKSAKSWDIYGIVQKASAKYELESTKKAIISNAAYRASLIGVRGAWILMKEDIAKAGLQLGMFGKAALYARAGVAMLAGAAATLGAVLGGILNWVGLLAGAFALFDGLLSKNSKQMEAFNSALESSTSAVDNASRTIALLDKKGGFASGTIQGINALSNALTELADSAETSFNSSQKALDSLTDSWYDRTKNNIKKLWDGDINSKLAESLGKQVESSIAILAKTGLSDEAEKSFKNLLKVESLDATSIEEALSKLDKVSQKKVVDNFKTLNTELGNSASRLTTFKNSTDTAYKAYQEFIQSTGTTSPLFKLGAAFETIGASMTKLVGGDLREITAAFDDLVKNPEKAALFGDSFAEGFVKIRQSFEDQTSKLESFRNAVKSTNIELEKQQKIFADETRGRGRGDLTTTAVKAKRNIEELSEKLRELKKFEAKVPTYAIEEATKLFVSGMSNAFKEGADLIDKALGQASQKAAIAISRAQLGGLSGENLAKETTKLNQQELNLQLQLINTNEGLIKSQEKLSAIINESNTIALEEKLAASGTAKEKENAAAARASATAFKDAITSSVGRIDADAVAKAAGLNELATSMLKATSLGFNQKMAAQEASRREIGGRQGAETISGKMATESGRLQDTQKLLALQAQLLQTTQSRSNILNSIVGTTNKELVTAQAQLDIQVLRNKQTSELAEINSRIIRANIAQNKNEVAKLTGEKAQIEAKQAAEESNLLLQNRQKLLAEEITQIGRLAEIEKSNKDLSFATQQSQLEITNARLAASARLGVFSDEYITNQQYSLDINKADLENIKARAEATLTYKREEEVTNARIAALYDAAGDDPLGPDPQLLAAANIQLAQQEVLRNNAIAQADITLNKQKDLLNITKQVTDEQTKYNNLLENATTFADALGGAFGDLGSKLSGITKAIADFAISTDKSAKAQKDLFEKSTEAEAAGNYDVMVEAANGYRDVQKKSQKEELTGLASIAGATKGFFKEKTGAFKAFAAIEKTIHITRLAMSAKEILAEVSKTGSTIVNSMARAGAKGLEAITGAYAAPWPIGFVAGAAMTGIIVSLLGKAFGGGKGAPTGFSAEEQQKVQGTGMSYSSGKLDRRSGGVFGDDAAKADSIVSSIETLGKNFFNMLGAPSSKIVDTLRKIEINTLKTASALVTSAGGTFGKGSIFETETGKVASVLGGVYSRSVSILDAGIKVAGTISDIVSGAGSMLNYENIKSTKKYAFGIIKDSSYSTKEGKLDPQVQAALRDLIGATGTVLKDSAEFLYGPASAAANAIDNFNVDLKVSKKDLTGKEFAEALLAEISVQLNAAAAKAFPELTSFQQAGEEFYETVARIVKTSETLTYGLDLINLSITETDRVARVAVEQSLVEKAGGLEKLSGLIEDYYTRFFTEEEQRAIKVRDLNKRFTELQLPIQTTSTGFRTLVESLRNVDTDSAQTMLVELLKMAPVFDDVYKSANKANGAITSLMRQVLELTGQGGLATLLDRQSVLDLITDPQQLNLQKYVYALQDLKTAEDDLAAARSAEGVAVKDQINQMKSTISTIKNAIQSLKQFRDSLKFGQFSTLTPAQRYAESRRALEDLAVTATSASATQEERSAALSKLEGAASTYLEASRTYNASSQQFTTDVSYVENLLSTTESSLADQLTEAERQVELLTSIDSNILSVAEATDKLARAQTAVDTAKTAAFTTTTAETIRAMVTRALGENPSLTYSELMAQAYGEYRVDVTSFMTAVSTEYYSTARQAANFAYDQSVAVITNISNTSKAVTDSIKTLVDNTATATASILDNINTSASNLADAGGSADASTTSTSTTGATNSTVSDAIDSISATISGAIDSIANTTISEAIAAVSDTVTSAITAVTDAIGITDSVAAAADAAATSAAASAAAASAAADSAASAAADASPGDSGSSSSSSGDGPAGDSGSSAWATGGLAYGQGLVGERGPEFVDFENPARVYTAEQTRGMFMPTNQLSAVVQELRYLREEVATLRAQQQTQTGHLITATYDAQSQNAQQVTETLKQTTQQQIWTQKVKETVKLS